MDKVTIEISIEDVKLIQTWLDNTDEALNRLCKKLREVVA